MTAFVVRKISKIRIGMLMAFVLAIGAGVASAEKFTAEPTVLIYRISIAGDFAGLDPDGNLLFSVSGPAVVPTVTGAGLIKDPPRSPYGLFESQLTIEPFSFASPPPIVRFKCGDCTLTLMDGSVFHTYEPIQMEGRALFMLGPVLQSAETHENPNVVTIRMAGCGGIQGVSGPQAGKVGTLCANGTFSFDPANPATMTGESHCTITLHTPAEAP